ncbi:MAG: rhodanese-like domain-containing protein [Ignavibacteriaceae bacterium]
MIKRKIKLLLFITLIISNGCLEDVIPPPFTGELNKTAEMLVYFEEQGDFSNSNLAPALIEAQEVFDNIDYYLIIDLRANDEYVAGHIKNSINVVSDSLYQYVNEIRDSNYSKIVLVSKNGQSSAYFTCLLRLAGYSNIYTLDYGMASWHNDFADEWLNAVGDDSNVSSFTNHIYTKNDLTDLPNPPLDNPNAPIEEIIQGRIKKIINEGFNFTNSYFTGLFAVGDAYLICYGNTQLYGAKISGTLGGLGHPEGTVSYFDSPFFEFRSIKFLQTLPNNSDIAIYGYNGQLSAFMTAYLKILGYKVKTFLFGANTLFYSRMITTGELIDFAFTSANIMNFEYVIGNQ